MPPPWEFIEQADLEAALGASVVRRLLDDDNDGTPDAERMTRVIQSASSKLAGFLRPVYTEAGSDLDAIADGDIGEVKRITIDFARAILFETHPEFGRGDWAELLKAAERDAMNLRKQVTVLDVVGAPEPRRSPVKGAVVSTPRREPLL